MSPPTTPTSSVGMGLMECDSWLAAGPLALLDLACRAILATMATDATRRAHPSRTLRSFSTRSPDPSALRMSTPERAAGTEPMHSHLTRRQSIVPRLTWTPPPMGFITSDASRSLETAVVGVMLKSRTRIGVIRAPPPMPVRPTVKPTIRPARPSATGELPDAEPCVAASTAATGPPASTASIGPFSHGLASVAPPMDLSGRVAIVTGARRGVGAGTAVALAHAGCNVVCAARATSDRPMRLPGTVEETAARCKDAGVEALAVPTDLSDEASIVAMVDAAVARFGRVDILVNNA